MLGECRELASDFDKECRGAPDVRCNGNDKLHFKAFDVCSSVNTFCVIIAQPTRIQMLPTHKLSSTTHVTSIKIHAGVKKINSFSTFLHGFSPPLPFSFILKVLTSWWNKHTNKLHGGHFDRTAARTSKSTKYNVREKCSEGGKQELLLPRGTTVPNLAENGTTSEGCGREFREKRWRGGNKAQGSSFTAEFSTLFC